MKLALIGYGKMGKTIHEEAVLRGHEVVFIADKSEDLAVTRLQESGAQAIIEFTHPQSVMANLEQLLPLQIPLVCGTTGWNAQFDKVQAWVKEHDACFMYSSNFSIGVNLLFKLNETLAKLMNPYPQYDCFIEEQHHRHKADAPSGTALSLAEDILGNLERKNKIATDSLLHRKPEADELSVGYIRGGEIVGRHKVYYSSETDTITLEHHAHNRKGFAIGSVVAAEWLQGKRGFYHFSEVFG
ncbi:MAG: 4-hydroxy-tetrahydrodipicolinate reductase [Bacteroidia bacterium]